MKKFGIILGSIVGLILVLVLAVNLYFTDERLRDMVMPVAKDYVGENFSIQELDLSILGSLPNVGLKINKADLKTPEEQPVASFDQLIVEVKLIPLLSSAIEFDKITLLNPDIVYTVDATGKTNIDFILDNLETTEEAPADTSASTMSLNIEEFVIEQGNVQYSDATTKTDVTLADISLYTELAYAQTIRSLVDLTIGGVTAQAEGTQYVSDLRVDVNQESVFDLENGTLELTDGGFSIQGLSLDLKGMVSGLNDEFPVLDLTFKSSSEDFSTLLDMVPAEYAEELNDIETRGKLDLNGEVKGKVGGEDLPEFKVYAAILDGYLKYQDFKPVEEIALQATADNDQITITRVALKAGVNSVNGKGVIRDPLKDNPTFDVRTNVDLDLSTIKEYYDLTEQQITELKGKVKIIAEAEGNANNPEKAKFNADMLIENGFLQYDYPGVTKPFTIPRVNINATQSKVTIREARIEASSNTISASGTVTNPLDEKRTRIDISTKANVDLATIKEFYPIDTDTLDMRGKLTADVRLRAALSNLENPDARGSLNLTNGYVNYHLINKPIEQISLSSTIAPGQITLRSMKIKAGGNQVSATGNVKRYLSDNPLINLKVNSQMKLAEINDFYDISEFVNKLTGDAKANLTLSGPAMDPMSLKFNGGLDVSNVFISQDSLPADVENLNVDLQFSDKSVKLNNLSMNMKSSDIAVNGSLSNYKAFVTPEKDGISTLTGSFNSTLLDIDELIEFEETPEEEEPEPMPIELPELRTSVNADIKKMQIMGVTMTNLKAAAQTNQKQIKLNNASVNVFDGAVSGAFTWDVPRPDRTKIDFTGKINNVRAEAFFKEFKIGGKDTEIHKYLSGGLLIDAQYSSELDVYLTPDLKTSNGEGSFGMTQAILENHPVQVKAAELLKSNGLKRLAISEWDSQFTITDGVLELRNLKFKTSDTGVEINGTHNMVNGNYNMKMSLYLPPSAKSSVESVLGKEAAGAIKQEDGTFYVPLVVKGTSGTPRVTIDTDAVKELVQKYLKDNVEDKAKDIIKGLFDN